MLELRIRNWNELNDVVFQDSWFEPLGRFRAPFAFRGMSSAKWDLQTSLMRLGGPYASLETSLLRNFQKYGYRNADSGGSFWHWLAVAQHHGLPTRLLDWSMSPHVAAHFATEDLEQLHVDGVIWGVDMLKAHARLPESLLSVKSGLVFTTSMLDRFAPSLEEFDERLREGCRPGPIFLEPPSLDDRIVNQAAFLSIMSPATQHMDEWLQTAGADLSRKIIIPASVKFEIRDKLDMMNITERMIYPGLDGLSKWLKRYYSPLNIIELTYPDGGKLAGAVLGAASGVLTVKLFGGGDAYEERVDIESREDGLWRELRRDCTVQVKFRASGPEANEAYEYVRGLRDTWWQEMCQQGLAARSASMAALPGA